MATRNRIVERLITDGRKAYKRRARLLMGKGIDQANLELGTAISVLAGLGQCGQAGIDEHGLVTLTTAHIELFGLLEAPEDA